VKGKAAIPVKLGHRSGERRHPPQKGEEEPAEADFRDAIALAREMGGNLASDHRCNRAACKHDTAADGASKGALR
jgi:hypothetical protein